MPRLQYELGQSTQVMEYYPPGMYTGTPTVVAYTGGTTATLFTQANVTADAASQTSVTASEGDATITVTSSANFIVGRRYWIDDGAGRGYEDTLIGIPDATTLRFQGSVKWALASGSVKGHGLRRTLTETSSTRRWCRVVWRYTIDGVDLSHQELFDIVVWPFSLDCTETELEQADAAFGSHTGRNQTWQGYKAMAGLDIWQAIEGLGVKPDLVRSRDILKAPFIYRTLLHRHGRDEMESKRYAKLYTVAMSAFSTTKDGWYDRDDDMIAGSGGVGTVYVGSNPITVYRDGFGGLTITPPVSPSPFVDETSGFPAVVKLKAM